MGRDILSGLFTGTRLALLLELVQWSLPSIIGLFWGCKAGFLATNTLKSLAQCLSTSYFLFSSVTSMVFIKVYSPLTPPPFLAISRSAVINLAFISYHC